MRRVLLLALPIMACTAAFEGEIERGGQITVVRSLSPSGETFSAVAAFFAPPGPAEDDWPVSGACVRTTATPVPTATATPVVWRDAGPTIALHGAATLTLSRFDTGGVIQYLAPPGTLPEAVPLDSSFDVEIEGSDLPNGVPARNLDDALVMPAPIALAQPSFAGGPIAIAGSSMVMRWDASGSQSETLVFMLVTGTNGVLTSLQCSTPDDGEYILPDFQLAPLETGSGIMGVMRRERTISSLEGTIDFVGVGLLVESGPIVLP